MEAQTEQQLRARARSWAYERLALASAVVWTVGAALLLATVVPYIPHPQAYIALATVVPLIPAALPWIWFRRLTDSRLRELSAQQP